MRGGLSYHVIRNPKGGWSVKKYGASRASRTFHIKRDAIAYARGVCKAKKFKLVIHKKDGAVYRLEEYK